MELWLAGGRSLFPGTAWRKAVQTNGAIQVDLDTVGGWVIQEGSLDVTAQGLPSRTQLRARAYLLYGGWVRIAVSEPLPAGDSSLSICVSRGGQTSCVNGPVQIEQPQSPVQTAEMTFDMFAKEVAGLPPIRFERDSSKWQDFSSAPDRILKLLQQYPHGFIAVEGYTAGEKGGDTLARERATGVRDFLIQYGVPSSRLLIAVQSGKIPEVRFSAAPPPASAR
jgi:outer membrane protein OmpA-like peptidoglycan-associated protein